MERSFYYVESRGGKYDETMMAGVAYLTKILEGGVTAQDIDYANEFYKLHFGQDIFNYEGWMRIVNELGGKLPVRIRAVQEGQVIPVKNVLLTIENTVDGFGWLCGYLETFILRAIWYPTTVATISFRSKVVIAQALLDSSDLELSDYEAVLGFRLHDFGARGVSSGESAAIGGLAHLYNFQGSDTVESIELGRNLFGCQMAGFSVPAREHSTTTCYLREGEYEAFMNSAREFGGGIFAVVIDSYSTKAALEWLTTNEEFINIITEKGGQCVLRPDSGLPIDMVRLCLDTVAKNVGYTTNTKGFKVLDSRFRVIQGDGVDGEAIERITTWVVYTLKYSQENFNYGMGGGLLQHCDRDTQKFAMKCSAMKVSGAWRDVYKAPETDPTKKSKAGRLDLTAIAGEYMTVLLQEEAESHPHTIMDTVFEDGERYNVPTLEDIRSQANFECTLLVN